MHVLVVDDHPLVGEAFAHILKPALPGATFHRLEAFNPLLEHLTQQDFDLLLLDLNMPDMQGMSGLIAVRDCAPDLPTVVISQCEDVGTIGQCLKLGASGFIPKSSSKEAIRQAIDEVMKGEVSVPPAYLEAQDAPSEDNPFDALTPKQRSVYQAMLSGQSNKQIAYDMNISEWTVKVHVSAILKKLGVNNRVEAVLLAQRSQGHA